MSEVDATEEVNSCPFCGATISQDLALYGGTCPRCFGEVPGEEAITDPGDQPTEIGLRVYEVKSRVRQVVPLLGAVGLMVILGLWGLWLVLFPPSQRAAGIDFDQETDFDFMAEMVEFHLDQPEPEAQSEEQAPRRSTGAKSQPRQRSVPAAGGAERSASSGSATNVGPSNALLSGAGAASVASGGTVGNFDLANNTTQGDEFGSRRSSAAGAAMPTDNGPDLTLNRTSSSSSPLGLGVAVTAEREKPLLKDPDEIKQHVYNVMKKSLPTLTQCYEQRLKQDSSVRGKWRISFVITTSGSPIEAEASGISMSDAPLEECIRGKIARWSFFRLPSDQPVSKSVTFAPR